MDIAALKESNHYRLTAKAEAEDFYSTTLPKTEFSIRFLVLIAKAELVVNLMFCLNGKEISVKCWLYAVALQSTAETIWSM